MSRDFTSNHYSSIYSQWLPDTMTIHICWYKMRIWKWGGWGGILNPPLHTLTFAHFLFFFLLVICSFSQSHIRKHIHFLKLRKPKTLPNVLFKWFIKQGREGRKRKFFFFVFLNLLVPLSNPPIQNFLYEYHLTN